VGLVDGAPSLQLSGGLAGVHPVPVDGSLEESGTTWSYIMVEGKAFLFSF
jgi:hypothetical protein